MWYNGSSAYKGDMMNKIKLLLVVQELLDRGMLSVEDQELMNAEIDDTGDDGVNRWLEILKDKVLV